MGFNKLIEKVTQAEHTLEAHERSVGVDWRQLKLSWRAAWTPGRIVVAGLASGFLVGCTRPLRHATGGGILQMITALSGLIASGNAQVAADNADDAAEQAEATAEAVGAEPPAAAAMPRRPATPQHDPVEAHERLRRSGLM